MEHHDKALPIDIRTLGDLAERVHAYAKALHYKETGIGSDDGDSTLPWLVRRLILCSGVMEFPIDLTQSLILRRLPHSKH